MSCALMYCTVLYCTVLYKNVLCFDMKYCTTHKPSHIYNRPFLYLIKRKPYLCLDNSSFLFILFLIIFYGLFWGIKTAGRYEITLKFLCIRSVKTREQQKYFVNTYLSCSFCFTLRVCIHF